jgi:FtsH-binding integral membrane protein
MTKWARMRRRKERKREESLARSDAEGKEVKLTEPENIPNNIQHSQKIEEPTDIKTSKPNPILTQIPRYAYLIAIFTLLAGVFFPLITPQVSFNLVVQGTGALFLGLAGGILLFKTPTSKRRGIFIVIGFVLIAISLVLIYHVRETGYL